MKDYYYILGINNDATEADIKKAYRKLSLKFHPDKNDGDKFFEERFKDINEAYENLIDSNRRRLHDSILYSSNFKSSQNVTSNQPRKEEQQRKQESKEPKKKQFYADNYFSTKNILIIITSIIICCIIKVKYDLSQKSSQIISSNSKGIIYFNDYDGNVYYTETFGELTWTKNNLDVTHFRNGDTILQAKNDDEWNEANISKTPAWRYLNDNPNACGKLYNGFAILDQRGLAPEGYRIPSSADWENLIGYMYRNGWKDFSLIAGFPKCIIPYDIFWSSTKSQYTGFLISVSRNSSDDIYYLNFGTNMNQGLYVKCVDD